MANPNYDKMSNEELMQYVIGNYQSRSEIRAEDSRLYQKLVELNLLREVFPITKRNLSACSLDDFVQEVADLGVKSASELKSKDPGLYSVLQSKKLLRSVIKRKNN